MGLVTQQDPIGIAGGLNLYGYANGDPVNYSDPFGLCVEEDQQCWKLVAFLREFEGETFNNAADRLASYEGLVVLTDGYPYSGQTNERSMQLRMGASTENTPGGGSRSITPGKGDLALLLVHETGHLRNDGSCCLLHDNGGAVDTQIEDRVYRAFFELDPNKHLAPIFMARERMRRR